MNPDSEPLLLRKRQNHKNSSENSKNMEARAEHQTKHRFKIIYGISAVIGITLAVLVLVWCIHYRGGFAWQSDPAKEFNWHPLLMIFSICLYSQSLLIFRTGRNFSKSKLKLVHMFLYLLTFILAVVALQAAFDSHNLKVPPTPNLYTLHSWFGLITIIAFTTQFVGGFITFLFPGLPQALRAAILPAHTSMGIAIFFLAIVSATSGIAEKAIFGLGDKYPERISEAYMMNFMGLTVVVFGALILYLVNAQEYKRVALPDDQLNLGNRKE